MNQVLSQISVSLFGKEKHERTKIMLLSLTYLFVIAAYTMIYDLKSSIFMTVVGREYVPYAKGLAMVVLIPAILFYSLLVDKLRRYQLLYFYSIAYAIFGFICAYVIGHPTIGLLNTDASPWRLFGWVFYFFVEGYSPFVVSVFWAFSNSVSDPQMAKKNYGVLVSGSKLGGILSAGFAWFFLTMRDVSGKPFFSDVVNHQILLIVFSCFALVIPFVVKYLMKSVPGSFLHGYEAVYQLEKEKEKEKKVEKEESLGLWSGLTMLFSRPYILGIFGMLFFYEVLNAILSYQRLVVVQLDASSVSDISYRLYQQMFSMHLAGFFISLIGTRNMMRFLGERFCLLFIPAVNGLLLLFFWVWPSPLTLTLVFVMMKSVNYAFAMPVRESLYIPTVKDIKFKSKAWIDAFGSKMARGCGSVFNIISDFVGPVMQFVVHGSTFILVIIGWLATAYLLGKRYARAVKNNEVIGS